MEASQPRRFLSSFTAVLAAVVVISVAATGAAFIPMIRCPVCGPLYMRILGPEASPDSLLIDCPNCEGRRRIPFLRYNFGKDCDLVNPWLVYLKYGDRRDDLPRLAGPTIGPHTTEETRQALPVLIRAIQAKDYVVTRNAGVVLGLMGPDAAEAVPEIISALRDRSIPERQTLAEALGRIGVNSENCVPALMDVLREPEGQNILLRPRTIYGLQHFGAAAKPAIPLLIPLLQDSNVLVRAAVAFALSALGPEAKVAIPELKALANDSDDYSGSEAAKMALKRLDADKGEVQR